VAESSGFGRAINRLTARSVAVLKESGYYHDGAGLYLRIGRAGGRSWVFRYRRRKRLREMGLGSAIALSLASARASAAQAREVLAKGKDPIEERRAAQTAEGEIPTFSAAAASYIAAHTAGWKGGKHTDQWTNTLATYAEPVIGAYRVDTIGTDDVLRILTPIWVSKTETATRVRQRVESVLNAEYARLRIDRPNPARWKGHLDSLLPKPRKLKKIKHHPALPYSEVPGFMSKLRERYGVDARALEFLILTACRSNEIRGAMRAEIRGSSWAIPAERMKAAVGHMVPLAPAAMKVLEACPQSGLLFPRTAKGKAKRLSENALRALLIRMGYGHVTAHGFRSSFRDWVAEETDTLNIVAEKALAHTIPSEAEAAYRRGELLKKRKGLMDQWARYCERDAPASAATLA
jgi:integrase